MLGEPPIFLPPDQAVHLLAAMHEQLLPNLLRQRFPSIRYTGIRSRIVCNTEGTEAGLLQEKDPPMCWLRGFLLRVQDVSQARISGYCCIGFRMSSLASILQVASQSYGAQWPSVKRGHPCSMDLNVLRCVHMHVA